MKEVGSTASDRDAIANRAIGSGVNAIEDYLNGDAMAWRTAMGWFSVAAWNITLNDQQHQEGEPSV